MIILVARLELRFVVINKADGFVVTDDFDTVLVGVFGDAGEVAIGLGVNEVGGFTVEKPITVPTAVPTLHQETLDAKATAGVDIFDGVLGRGAVARTGSPRPFADVHCPPDAEEFERLDP